MSLLNNVENVLKQLHTAKTQLENMRREIQGAPAAESSTSQTATIGTIQPTLEQTRRIKEAFSCTICVDYFDSPYTLQCGHTFCKDCITTWFGRQKSCPGCRRDIIQRPVPAFTVEIQVNAIRSLIPSLGAAVRQTNQEQEQTVRQFERLLDDMFPARANASFIRDEEDGVDRCPNCAWELDDDGTCLQCNVHFRQAARPRDSSDSSESSDEEEDSDLNSFITSDGHVSVIQSDSSDDDSSDDDSDIGMRHRVYNIVSSADSDSDSSGSGSSSSSSSYSSEDAPIYLIPSSVSEDSSDDANSSDDSSSSDPQISVQRVSDTSSSESEPFVRDVAGTSSSSSESDDDSESSESSSSQDNQSPARGNLDDSSDSDSYQGQSIDSNENQSSGSDNESDGDQSSDSDNESNKNQGSDSDSSSSNDKGSDSGEGSESPQSSSSSDHGSTQNLANDTPATANTQDEPASDEEDEGELNLTTRKRRKLLNSEGGNSEDETPAQENKRPKRRSTRRR